MIDGQRNRKNSGQKTDRIRDKRTGKRVGR